MDSVENRLNEFFITTFNKILNSEERSLQKSELTDISVREIHIIEAVGLSKPYAKNTMSNIASEVGISLGALSTAVNALVRKGYISRGGDASDRRKVYIYLTETGEKAFLLHKEFHKKMISGITKLLNENECETLIKALSTITCFSIIQISKLR